MKDPHPNTRRKDSDYTSRNQPVVREGITQQQNYRNKERDTRTSNNIPNKGFETVPCKFYFQGKCLKSNNCEFVHSYKVPCKSYVVSGMCDKQGNCR